MPFRPKSSEANDEGELICAVVRPLDAGRPGPDRTATGASVVSLFQYTSVEIGAELKATIPAGDSGGAVMFWITGQTANDWLIVPELPCTSPAPPQLEPPRQYELRYRTLPVA